MIYFNVLKVGASSDLGFVCICTKTGESLQAGEAYYIRIT